MRVAKPFVEVQKSGEVVEGGLLSVTTISKHTGVKTSPMRKKDRKKGKESNTDMAVSEEVPQLIRTVCKKTIWQLIRTKLIWTRAQRVYQGVMVFDL
jgi:hypothetical protein